jgi:hypothetical protein
VHIPVLIVRPDDGPIGPKSASLFVLLMVVIDVFDGNINTLFLHITNLRQECHYSNLAFLSYRYKKETFADALSAGIVP